MTKRFLLSLLILCSLTVSVFGADKNTVTIRPGDTVYIRFEQKGKRIRLTHWSTEKDDAAQVICNFAKELKGPVRTMKVENKFPQDLVYKSELRSSKMAHETRGRPTPVVGGKVAFDDYGLLVEEVAFFDFKLER